MSTFSGNVGYTVAPPSSSSVTGTVGYNVTSGAGSTSVSGTVGYAVAGRPRLMVRSGSSLNEARLAQRQGSSIAYLSPPLS